MSAPVDLLIVGAGPAGLAAALRARAAGLDVLLVDEQPAPGGQIWRGIEAATRRARGPDLGPDYRAGASLVETFRASGVAYRPGTQIWQIEPGFVAYASSGGRSERIEARSVLVAHGAQERPVPFPGWTLPGVMTVGAAQILLKTASQIPDAPVWIAGCGPLVLLYARQLLDAGGEIAGILDTAPRANRFAALRHLPAALRNSGELLKGLGWLRDLRGAGVPILRGVSGIEALGGEALERIRYRSAAGGSRTVEARVLLVHEGVVPSIHMPLLLGCAHAWREDQMCFAPTLDAWGESSVERIFVAGDAAGIAGATAARLRGDIAALGIAARLGVLDRAEAGRRAAPLRARLARALAARPLLDALYRPRREILTPADDTVVCRCEEVTAGQVRDAAGVGIPGPNQVKAFIRCGMGPCQGRQCGSTVSAILSQVAGLSMDEIGFYRIRSPLKPLTLGEMATIEGARAPDVLQR